MRRTIELPNGRKIGDGQPCFVVAEIGQNHNGDMYLAVRLILAALKCQVDAIKFCKRHIPSDLTREARNAPYTGVDSFGPTYGRHREFLEFSRAELQHLKQREKYNEWPEILFSTACDKRSVDDLEAAWNPPLYKVASRDLDNEPLLRYIGRLKKPVILSTGMIGPKEAAWQTLDKAIEAIGHEDIAILHCVSKYPTADEEVGLGWIELLRNRYELPIGLSDHTPGIVAAQTAAALGANIVEKHFTVSRAMKGTDHRCSLEPKGMAKLVENIRAAEKMLRVVAVDTSEARKKLGRSLVSVVEIDPGTIVEEHHLTLKSPGDGIRWAERDKIIGRVARRYIPADVTLELSDVLEPAEVE